MFTKRELYLIARAIFDYKMKLKHRKENGHTMFKEDEFDDYIELSILHLKVKDFINENRL